MAARGRFQPTPRKKGELKMDGFEIGVSRDLIVVRPEGDFVVEAGNSIERSLVEKSYGAQFPRNVIFNMDGVGFIDSSGAALLLKISRMVVSNGGYFAIYNLNRGVGKTLELLRLDCLLNVCRTIEDCFSRLAAFGISRHETLLCSSEA